MGTERYIMKMERRTLALRRVLVVAAVCAAINCQQANTSMAAGCFNNGPNKPSPPTGPWGGEPVNMASGVYQMNRTDLVIPGLMPIVFGEVYRTENDGQGGRMGANGTDCYDYRIRGNPGDDSVVFTPPTNDRYSFAKQADGTYLNTDTYWLAGARLYGSGPLAWQLRFKDGTTFYFVPGFFSYALSQIIDRNGNTLQLIVDTQGNLQQIIQPSGRSLTVTRDGNNITSIMDNAGRTVSYVYSNVYLVAVTNTMGGAATYTYDPNNGNMSTITRPNGVQSLYNIYDSSSRVVTQIMADGGSFTFTYNTCNPCYAGVAESAVAAPAGGTTSHTANIAGFNVNTVNAEGVAVATTLDPTDNAPTQVIDEQSRTNSVAYDSAGNMVLVTSAQGKVTQFAYEPVYNQLTSVIDPLGHTTSCGYDGHGNLTSITDALGKVTTIVNNQFGQPISMTDPLKNTYTFTYDNTTLDLVSVADPLGNTARTVFDAIGRPIELIDPLGRVTSINYDALSRVISKVDLLGTTSFGYDSVGNLTNVTDALGHTVSYGYDVMNRISSRTDQLGNQETYAYDKSGNVTNFVDRRGVSIGFNYDLLNRRTRVLYASGDSVSYFYDNSSRVTNVVDSIAGATKLSYDTIDQLTQVIDINGTIAYVYNDARWRTSMTVAGQNPVFYYYDAANRLTNVVQGSSTTTLSYDDDGRRTNLTLPNGIHVQYYYDDGSRLTNITYRAVLDHRIDYAYDSGGSIMSRRRMLGHAVLPSGVSTSSYNVANQQLTFGTYAKLFDASGNVTNIVNSADGSTRSLVWSARNQLTAVSNGLTASFVYDGLGRRISRTVNGTTENYLYDGLDIIQQLDGGGAVGANFFRGLAIDEPWQRIDAGTTNTNGIYLADALGSVVALSDTNMALQTQYASEPFGAMSTTGLVSKNRYEFTARENDETGLYSYRARYYDPASGRFVSEDPVDYFSDNFNYYTYVSNDPLNLVDPLGLLEWYDIWLQNAANFSAGFGDNLSVGLTKYVRNQFQSVFAGSVDPCSGWYTGGQWSGTALSVAMGVAGGIEAAGSAGEGLEYSHWIPDRYGGPRSVWNGNYITTAEHALSDPYRYRFMPKVWKADNPLPNAVIQQLDRIPNAIWGTGLGAGYGAAGQSGGCGCP